MNEHVHPIFSDILNRQFAALYPATVYVPKPPQGNALVCIHGGTGDYMDAKEPKDRLAELQANLHVKEI